MASAAPPPLVDLNGRPLKRETLAVEIARPAIGSVRSIASGHPAQGLDPSRLANLLLAAENGNAIAYYELAEEMEEKDLHYLSVLGTRKRAVAQLPIEVEPADESEQAKADAKLVEDWLDRDMLEAEFFDILDAVGKGTSTVEIVWKQTKDSWLPSALKWRDPRWFEFDQYDGETLRLRGGIDGAAGMPEDLPAAKFITHMHPAKSGLAIRSGLARIAAWGYMFKNFAIKDWVTFLESFGHPLRIGKYGPNESEANKRILEAALYSLGSDAAAAFPDTMSVEFVDRKAGTAPNDLWRSHAEYFDLQISKAVLGQTNTTDAQAGGLGSGQANVHNDVRGDIERADAKILAATLNRDLVVPIVMLNHGLREKYPRLKIGRPDEVDVAAMITSAKDLVAMGVRIDGEELRERAGLPAEKDPKNVLVAPSKSAPIDPEADPATAAPGKPTPGRSGIAGGARSQTALLGPLKAQNGADRAPGEDATLHSARDGGRDPDFIDRTTAEAIDDWEPLVAPLFSSVEDLIDGCSDMAELQSRLAEALGDMDVSAFTELLAKGSFATRVAALADPARNTPAE